MPQGLYHWVTLTQKRCEYNSIVIIAAALGLKFKPNRRICKIGKIGVKRFFCKKIAAGCNILKGAAYNIQNNEREKLIHAGYDRTRI